jgi:hypothetical protein
VRRAVWREKSPVQIGVLHPMLDSRGDYFLFNQLPFLQDVKTIIFPKLPPSDELSPSEEQMNAARDLIRECTLPKSAPATNTDSLSNPYVTRFFDFVLARAADPRVDVPEPPSEAQLAPGLSEKAKEAVGEFKKAFGLPAKRARAEVGSTAAEKAAAKRGKK